MYIERIPTGEYGVYRDDGKRLAIASTKEQANRYLVRLIRKRRKREEESKNGRRHSY